MQDRSPSPGPHDNTESFYWNDATSDSVKCVLILIHGRESCPEDDWPIFEATCRELDEGKNQLAVIALRAQDQAWYPQMWTAPVKVQEPYLSSALNRLHKTISELSVPPSRVVLCGFSQGAGLSMTYLLRNPQRLGGVLALAGSIVGNPDDWVEDIEQCKRAIDKTPVFLGWGDKDFVFRRERAVRDAQALRDVGAEVEYQLFPNKGHFVVPAELDKLKEHVRRVMQSPYRYLYTFV